MTGDPVVSAAADAGCVVAFINELVLADELSPPSVPQATSAKMTQKLLTNTRYFIAFNFSKPLGTESSSACYPAMRMNQFFLSIKGFLLIAMALPLLLAGCGSGNDSATGSSAEVTVETGSLSKAEFIKRANAICRETTDRIEREVSAVLEEQSEDPAAVAKRSPETELVETGVVLGFQKQIDEISSLGAPPADKQEVTAFLNALQQIVNKASADPEAFIRSKGSFGKAPELAKAYGFTGCGEIAT